MSLENAVGLVLAVARARLPDLRARLSGAARMSTVQLAAARRPRSRSCSSRRACSAPTSPASSAAAGRSATASSCPSSGSSTASAASIPTREQTWPVYALALLAFSLVSVLGLYALQRVQGSLPLDPTDAKAVPPALAFNTAVSFVTNTNWQNYGGELTMSHLTQMAGLTVQNFVSAAVGLAVAVALIRGFVRRRSATIGNFWVDLTRGTIRVLLPLAIVVAIVLASQGVVQNLHGFTHAHDGAGRRRSRSRAARSRARRRSRSSARTAAARTTPTRRTRSRTRTASRTCSRSSSS